MNKKLIWMGLISLLVFTIILSLISSNNFNFLEKTDLSANSFMVHLQTSFLTELSKIIAVIFDTVSMVVISLIIALVLWIRKKPSDSVFFALVMLANAGFIYILKEIVQRARPLNFLVTESGFAFPSGHATTSIVFFGLLGYLTFKYARTKKVKIWASVISVFMVLLIGFSRVYLNVHWVSDVLGGFAIGLFILSVSMLIRNVFD